MKVKSIAALSLLASLTLASCLKNKNDIGLISDKGSIVVEIPEATYNAANGLDQTVAFTTTPTQETVVFFTLRAHYPRDNKPASDIRVKLTMSPVSGFDQIPANALTLPTEVVIPKDKGEVTVAIPVNKAALDLTKDYAATFKIAQVSEGVISDFGKEITTYLVIKNPYDADYTVTGFLFHPSSPRAIARNKHLYTQGPNRCYAELGDLGGSGYYFSFDVDANNNLVNWGLPSPTVATPPAPQSGFFTADNPGGTAYPGPELPGTAPYVHSTYNNKYDPATKTFWMHYGYGVGSTGPTGWTRQVYEKWVRK